MLKVSEINKKKLVNIFLSFCVCFEREDFPVHAYQTRERRIIGKFSLHVISYSVFLL